MDEITHLDRRGTARTGVEMEAPTVVAGLTLNDMLKARSKAMVLTDVRLLAKSVGRSGGRCVAGSADTAGGAA